MKKLFAGLVAIAGLAVSMPAVAQHYHHSPRVQPLPRVVHQHHVHRVPQRHWHPHHGWVWVVPTVIGGAIVYDIIRHKQQTAPTITEEVVQTAPVVTVAPTKMIECTEWREIQGSDGKVYRERSCKEVSQ